MVQWTYLGTTEYSACWELQKQLCNERERGMAGDTLLLTEHHPVYTIGRTGNEDHLLAKPDELERRRIAVVYNDRGGDITYHGPGQLVGYPILDLRGYYLDLHRYLRDLEEVVIQTVSEYGVRAGRKPEYTGVWVGNQKICALGIKSRRWVTMHGFALNVNTEMSHFDRIIPCGIFEHGVTSLKEVLGREVPITEVVDLLVVQFGRVFGCAMVALEMPVGCPEGAKGLPSGCQ